MRKLVPFKALIPFALAGLLGTAAAGTKATSTWKAEDLKPRVYQKVLVLAKLSDNSVKRILEDAVVKGLADKGVTAVAAYKVLEPADLASGEAIRAKAGELGIDAGIVFTVTRQDSEVKSGPSVHASMGVPVRAGPFSMFLGTSVPLGGGPSVVKKIGLKAEFFNGSEGGPAWIGTYSTDLKAGPEREVKQLANLTLKQLSKTALLEKP